MLQDVRLTIRRLRQSPLYSIAVVAILALGIGITTAMLNVLYTLVWRAVRIPEPKSLVAVSSVNARGVERVMPLATLTFLERSTISKSSWCAYNAITETSDAGGSPVDAYVALLSGDCPQIINVPPVLGRWFESNEVRLSGASQAVAVISHAYWRRVFNEDPAVLGRTLRIFNSTVTVVGVLPRTFQGLSKDYDTDIFVPFNAHRPASNALTFITRLKKGESIEILRTQASAIWPSLLTTVLPPGPTLQQSLKDVRAAARPLANGFSRLRDLYESPAAALAALSVVLLLLICLNVGGLFVSRWMERRQEVVTMLALGAHSRRIARLILTEAIILALIGSAVALPVAYFVGSSFARLLPVQVLTLAIDFRPDRYVIGGVLTGSLALAVIISTFPIWSLTRARRIEPSERGVARKSSFWGRVLLIGQVAIAVGLIFTTTLIVRSLDALWRTDRGFRSGHLLSARLFPNPGAYQNLDQLSYYPELMRRLREIPGVQSVGAARYFSSIDVVLTSGQPISFDGVAEVTTNAFLEYVSPDFFATLGVPILYGRDVNWMDLPASTPIALASESLAKALGANGADVIGRTIRLGTGSTAARLVVVGVVGNLSLGNFRQADHRLIYRAGLQAGQATMSTMHLRTEGQPMSIAKAVTETVASFNHEHVIGPYELDRLFANSLVAERIGASVGLTQAILAVLISCLGLYALIAQTVAIRMKEIGIRLALGARPMTVWRKIVKDGLVLVILGVVVGYPAALGAGSLVRSLLFKVNSTDLLSFVLCSALLLICGAVAASIPAWRATRIDPVQTLRHS